MPTCNVTGIVYYPNGDPIGACNVMFRPRELNITDWVIGAVVPKPVIARSDVAGAIDVELIPGGYTIVVQDWHGWVAVPDAAAASVSDILDNAAPVEPVPSWLEEARAARDAAEAAAIEAGDSADEAALSAAAAEAAALTLGATAYATYADLPVSPPPGSIGYVFADPDPAKLGLWFWSGSVWVQDELNAVSQTELATLVERVPLRPVAAMLVDDVDSPVIGYHSRKGVVQASPSGLVPVRPADAANPWQNDGWPEYYYNETLNLRLPKDIARRAIILPGYGQSLAGGANDNPADALINAVATYPDNALMPSVGPAPGGQYFDRFRPLVDIAGTGFDSRRSHWLSPMANTIISTMDSAFGVRPTIISFSASQGGRSWDDLMPGNPAFLFFAKGLQCACATARKMGLIPWVPAVMWIQGEQDRGEGLSQERIRRDRQSMAREVTALVRALTGQPDDPLILISQPNNSVPTDGIIPAHMTAPVSLDGEGNILLLPPHYDLPMSSTDPDVNTGVHPSSAGYQTIGIRIANVILDTVFGRGYTAVKVIRAWWENSQTVRMLYQVRTAPLVIDTSGSVVVVPTWPGSLNGWQFFDGSVSPPAVASMTVIDDPNAAGTQLTVLRIVLSGPPTGPAPRFHYATRNDGTGANSGQLTGARGCIRDSSNPPFPAASQVIYMGMPQ